MKLEYYLLLVLYGGIVLFFLTVLGIIGFGKIINTYKRIKMRTMEKNRRKHLKIIK